MSVVAGLPSPATQPGVGHLGRWGTGPLDLIEEGARLGPLFALQLWRRAVVGYSPEWNAFVLGDLQAFRSRGSMSALSPYLGAGVIALDEPGHRPRRRALNPAFTHAAVRDLGQQITEIVTRRLPTGTFDAQRWASAAVRDILGEIFFAGFLPAGLLRSFLSPLDSRLPGPLLRRPVLFARVNRALRQAIDGAPEHALGSIFAGLDDGVAEARVALAAGYDTTAHSLAWLLFHLADADGAPDPDIAHTADEVLRLYPAGWIGSRRAAYDTSFEGVHIPRGTMVLYSPYLTHRSPAVWPDPLQFSPQRFAQPAPAYGYIPFAAGERTCLGRALARLILTCVGRVFALTELSRVAGDPRPRAGLTLAPAEPLILRRRA